MDLALRTRRIAASLDNRPRAVGAAVFVFAVTLRLLFIAQTHDVPQIRPPTTGLDIQIGWEAARGLRGEAPTNPSFELMMLSTPLYPCLLAAQQSMCGRRSRPRPPAAMAPVGAVGGIFGAVLAANCLAIAVVLGLGLAYGAPAPTGQ